jgi:hypothetical protein
MCRLAACFGAACLVSGCWYSFTEERGTRSCEAAPEGVACGAGTGAGRCFAGECCTGCWDGVSCLTGAEDVACGTGGLACSTCESGRTCDSERVCRYALAAARLIPGASSVCALSDDEQVRCLTVDGFVTIPDGPYDDFASAPQYDLYCARRRADGGIYCWGAVTSSDGSVADAFGASFHGPFALPGAESREAGRLATSQAASPELWLLSTESADHVRFQPTATRAPFPATSGLEAPNVVEMDFAYGARLYRTDEDRLFSSDGPLSGRTSLDPIGLVGPGFLSMTTTSTHACALRQYEGELGVWCWGSNESTGRLGTTEVESAVVPRRVELPEGFVLRADAHVSIGPSHSCVHSDGALVCWGEPNVISSRGDIPVFPPTVMPPPDIAARYPAGTVPSAWRDGVAAGNGICGVDIEGALHCWGQNGHHFPQARQAPLPE